MGVVGVLISGDGEHCDLLSNPHLGHMRFTGPRSVHNTRIERLWYDVTHGYGLKWKDFFFDLEVHHDLDPNIPAHIWLLHHLFLDAINQDAQEWAASWNSHVMQIQGERNRSPADMFFFSLVQDGARGVSFDREPVDEQVDDPQAYGVDWDVADDPQLMAHLLENNPQDWDESNPFQVAPSSFSDVPCEAPGCPFTLEEVALLNESLAADPQVDLSSRNMQMRRRLWVVALNVCIGIWQRRSAQ